MKKRDKVVRNSTNRRWIKKITYFLTIFIFLVGLFLVLIANIIPQKPYIWPSFLTTIGMAFLVSGTITFLQRHFTAEIQYQKILKDSESIICDVLETNFKIIETCTKLGVRQVYPAWTDFVNQDLPTKLELLHGNLIVVGSALTSFSTQIAGGELHRVIEKKLTEGKKFTFCTIKPGSSAAKYRENELNQIDAATTAAANSLVNFNNLRNKYPKKDIEILTLSDIVPKATYLCIDGKSLFVSYYFTSARTASSLVIEVHEGSNLFDVFKNDLDCLIKASTPWIPPTEEIAGDVT